MTSLLDCWSVTTKCTVFGGIQSTIIVICHTSKSIQHVGYTNEVGGCTSINLAIFSADFWMTEHSASRIFFC